MRPATTAQQEGAATTDVTGLIADDHARILRLFTALDDLARAPQPHTRPAGLASTWDRLAGLLELHIQAEEQICHPALLPVLTRDGLLHALATHDDAIRDAIAQAWPHQPGSIPWWRAVTDARAATHQHIRAGTQHLLPLLGHADAKRRSALGQRWATYTGAGPAASSRHADSPAGYPPLAADSQLAVRGGARQRPSPVRMDGDDTHHAGGRR
jgi:hypothetical protein